MTEKAASKHRVLEISGGMDYMPSSQYDEDGRPKRTGTLWTSTSHIITAVIGSGVLSLAWAFAQLGWIAGPVVMFLFSAVTYYMAAVLADSYRTGDPVTGKRNYTYLHAVRSILGGLNVKFCGVIQYLNLIGLGIGYTIAASLSMVAIRKADCLHHHHKSPCNSSSNVYMISFGAIQIFLNQIPDFDQIWWLSIVAAIMSFTYSTIGLILGIAKIAESGQFKGSLTGVTVGTVTETQKVWRSFQALGNIAFAYSFAAVLIEIQDTIKSPPPSESVIMRRAAAISIAVTTAFYILCGCMGYGAFGDLSPGNLLTGFGDFNPFWIVDIANVAIIVHLIGAYQVFSQPIFAFVETRAVNTWPESDFVCKEYEIRIPGCSSIYKLNQFRLVWRTAFAIFTTVVSMMLPFFNDLVGVIGAIGFWPLTVYFPMKMYIRQRRIPTWSGKWICLQVINLVCLIVSSLAAIGSVVGLITSLKKYKPFQSEA